MDIHLKTSDRQDSRALDVPNQGSCLGLKHFKKGLAVRRVRVSLFDDHSD